MMASREFFETYLKLARIHNDPATPKHEREIASWKAYGIKDAYTAAYGTTATGSLIMEADTLLHDGSDRPMCAGFYLDMDDPPKREPLEAAADAINGIRKDLAEIAVGRDPCASH
jgi:hypothetical protein